MRVRGDHCSDYVVLTGIGEPEPVSFVEKFNIFVCPRSIVWRDGLRHRQDGAQAPHGEDRYQDGEQLEHLRHIPEILRTQRHYHDGPAGLENLFLIILRKNCH